MADSREQALQHMRAALLLLDQSGAALDVGAHLDLAICRLEAAMADLAQDNEQATGQHDGPSPIQSTGTSGNSSK